MLAGRIGGLRCGGPLFDLAAEKGLEIHAFSACAARLSDFLLCLSCRECPIRPYGAPSPRGEGSVSGIAASSYRSLPHWGRGTASAVDRVLSYIAYLRRSPSLSFIPLEPYPPLRGTFPTRGRQCVGDCTCQQKLDTKLKKLGIKIEYLYKIQ